MSSKINHPDVPTIYGPVCQLVFLMAAWIQPGSLLPLKLVLIAADLTLLGMLSRSAPRRFLPPHAWCPLVLIEVSFMPPSRSRIRPPVGAVDPPPRAASGGIR